MITTALCFLIFNVCEDRMAAQTAQKVFQELKNGTMLQEGGKPKPEAEAKPAIPAYMLDPGIEMPTKEVEGEAYMGWSYLLLSCRCPL